MKRKELLLIIILIIGILSTITLISSNTKALPVSLEIDYTKKITYYEDEDLLRCISRKCRCQRAAARALSCWNRSTRPALSPQSFPKRRSPPRRSCPRCSFPPWISSLPGRHTPRRYPPPAPKFRCIVPR